MDYQNKDNKNNLLSKIKNVHTVYKLCGEPRNSLLNLSDELLLYIISILKKDNYKCPNVSLTEWYKLIEILDSHLLLPLIYWLIINNSKESDLPVEILNIIRRKYLLSSLNSINVENQLLEILNAFKKEHILVLVLKGPAVAHTVYPIPALRLNMDIDLLVLPDDVQHSRKILESIGYRCRKKYYDMCKSYYYEEGFIYVDTSKPKILVEVHWDLNNYPMFRNFNIHNLFDRAIEIKSGNLIFETLCPIDNILYLANHIGFKHKNDIRLNWLYDIYLSCNKFTIAEWKSLQEKSVEYQVRLILEKVLIMTQYWTDLKMPSEIADFTNWPQPSKNEVEAYSYITNENISIIKRFRLFWPRDATVYEKIKTLYYLILPSDEELHDQYTFTNNLFLPYYYIKRWIGLIKKM